MTTGINKVILIGHLGKAPEIKTLNDGVRLCNLSLATSERWTNKQTGQAQEHTEWHRLVLSDRLAEIAEKYLQKGSKIYIEGKLRTRKWQNQLGQEQYTTEVRVAQLQILSSRAQEATKTAEDYSKAVSPVQPVSPVQQVSPTITKHTTYPTDVNDIDLDDWDDIPVLRLFVMAPYL